MWTEGVGLAIQASLRQGAQQLGVSLDDKQVEQLLTYMQMISKWGRVYNLTNLLEPQVMLTHHVLDSLAVAPHIWEASGLVRMSEVGGAKVRPPLHIIDVGSGAGLPGVVLAVANPSWHITCVDTVGKKAAFIQQAALELGLPNLRAIHSRVEALSLLADVVVSRAFASLADFVQISRHLLKPEGVWLAMKGQDPQDEIKALPADTEVFHVKPLPVPGLHAERCLVWMRPISMPPF